HESAPGVATPVHSGDIFLRSAVSRGAGGDLEDLPCEMAPGWGTAQRRGLDRCRDQGMLPQGVAAESVIEGIGRVHRSGFEIGGGSNRSTAPAGVRAILD